MVSKDSLLLAVFLATKHMQNSERTAYEHPNKPRAQVVHAVAVLGPDSLLPFLPYAWLLYAVLCSGGGCIQILLVHCSKK